MIDRILKMFDPLISYSYKNYENNYMFYALFGSFIAFLALVGYIIFKLIT